VRDGDVVARLGGDEFAILQLNVSAPDDTRVLAARVVDLLARPFLLNGHVVNIGASAGVAMAPVDGETPEALLRNADLALYKAKAEGRGAFRMFEPGLDARMQARRALELDLRRAVARQEFEVHYQPLLDARSGLVTGAEALVRWRHAERGLVPPADFIPLAEETGLIPAIGQWVLRTACAEAATWPAQMSVAVNLSPIQFRDTRLADTIKSVLADTGLDPHRLELEITEGVLIADEDRTLATLVELRRCGVRIAMDDFGTGYSSLSYLRRFPFDKIKIDQSFIRQVPENEESAAIVRAIITLGNCLGMTTTVEGVETAEQLAFTSSEGCDHVQGFHLSRPLTAGAFADFLRRREVA
jgi:predicted signal transduction protein with EAL and GGDEF domain